MPPRGYKKGYVKHPDTGEYVDPRVLQQEREEKEKVLAPVEPVRKAKSMSVKKKVKDELGPETKSIQDTAQYATVIVSWKDQRGRDRSTQYIMADLNLSENVHETFENARKKTRIHLNLDGNVLEKV